MGKMQTSKGNNQQEVMETKTVVEVQVKNPNGIVVETKNIDLDLTNDSFNTMMSGLSIDQPDDANFGWVDEDGDFIRINSDQELATALAIVNCKLELRMTKNEQSGNMINFPMHF